MSSPDVVDEETRGSSATPHNVEVRLFLYPVTPPDTSRLLPPDTSISSNQHATQGTSKHECCCPCHKNDSGRWSPQGHRTPATGSSVDPWALLSHQTRGFDEDTTDRWNTQIDSLLVYAALFSAIIAAFIIEFYKNVTPEDDSMDAGHAMREISAQIAQTNVLLLAIMTGERSHLTSELLIMPTPLQNSTSSTQATDFALVYNGLWYLGLILTLIVASLATLVKQWILRGLEQDLRSPSLEHLRLRQHRHNSIHGPWGIPFIVGIFPLMLRASFTLFLLGLILQLYTLDHRLTFIAAIPAGLWVIIYTLTTLIPAIDPGCPYKSPESLLAFNVYRLIYFEVFRPLGIFVRYGSSEGQIKWQSWRDQELWFTGQIERRIELEVEAVVTASVDFSLSEELLTTAIEQSSRDFEPAVAMGLASHIAYRYMYRSEAATVRPDWRRIWDIKEDYDGPIRAERYKKITKRGIRAILDTAINTILRSRDFDPLEIGPSIACIATLLRYGLLDSEKRSEFEGPLQQAITKLLTRATAENLSDGDLLASLVPLYLDPARCDNICASLQDDLNINTSMSTSMAKKILENATEGPIYHATFRYRRYSPANVMYATFKLTTELHGGRPGDIETALRGFCHRWKISLREQPEPSSSHTWILQSTESMIERFFPNTGFNVAEDMRSTA